jgi:hypothetical protein
MRNLPRARSSMVTMPARPLAAFAATAAAALALAPGAAAGGVRPGPVVPVPLSTDFGVVGGWQLSMAVSDRGRVGFTADGHVGVIAAGSNVAAVRPVPSLFRAPDGGVALARDGTVVAGGSFFTGEVTADDPGDPHAYWCCDRPEVVRWRGPGHPLATFPVGPDRHEDLPVGAFALDREGTAYLVADHAIEGAEDAFDLAFAVRHDGHVVTRRLSVVEQDGAYGLDAAPDRVGASLLQVDGPRPRLLAGTASGWRARAIPRRLARRGFDLSLAPDGRLWSVTRRGGMFWLTLAHGDRVREIALGRVAGHRRTHVLHPQPHAFAAAMGADGTVAAIWTRGDAVLLRAVAPDGHRGPERRLGRIRVGDDSAAAYLDVDARGRAHAMFTIADGRVVAIGPRGRRVFGHVGGPPLRPAGIALSPGGAEALALATPTRRLVTVTPAP